MKTFNQTLIAPEIAKPTTPINLYNRIQNIKLDKNVGIDIITGISTRSYEKNT